ncbi:hypothetical protein PDJAM_G00126570 [Pangasius djambal]|uniref:Uncharacterized protein n=1 Tax=Pangasius djambal TaxID=1691987 RepID=A0ACC5ZB76_9TELE|nr:hypothetical protein [Pangasius djambal]
MVICYHIIREILKLCRPHKTSARWDPYQSCRNVTEDSRKHLPSFQVCLGFGMICFRTRLWGILGVLGLLFCNPVLNAQKGLESERAQAIRTCW